MERTPKLIAGIVIVIAIVGSLGIYGYRQSYEYLRGPVITITEPKNGSAATTSRMILLGTARNVSFLTLNGRQIFTDERGRFRELLLLHEGYNIMMIEAKDRFGHRVEKRLELVFKHDSAKVVIPPFLKEVPESAKAEDL